MPTPQQTIFELQVVGGPLHAQRFNFLPGGSYVIGRDPCVSIHIATKSVSRRHALVDTAGPVPILTDLGSANGMVVNGAKVTRIQLREGDILKLGEITLRFQTLAN